MPQEAKMQRKDKSAVRKSMVMLRPSMPTKYSMFQEGTQEVLSTNWKPASLRSKITSSQLTRTKEGKVNSAALQRTRSSRFAGRKQSTIIPANGMNMINVRM